MTKEWELPAWLFQDDDFVLDIGGEGRHPVAWNLNQRRQKSGASRVTGPIPRLILAKASAIPLADGSVDLAIVERTPLLAGALRELERVVKCDGRMLLRHAITPAGDPHRVALRRFEESPQHAKAVLSRQFTHRGYVVQETIIRRGRHA